MTEQQAQQAQQQEQQQASIQPTAAPSTAQTQTEPQQTPQALEQSLINFNTTAPEPAQQQAGADAYQSIIEQQNAQIAALIAQNDALTQQVTRMVQNGAQFTQQAPQVGQNQAYQSQSTLDGNLDMSLEALGKEIGKRS